MQQSGSKTRVDIEVVIKSGTAVQLKPQGTSMYPFIRPNKDEVILEDVEPASVHRGDVLLYRRDGSILVLHRMHHRAVDGFYMVGDNQVVLEGPVREDQLRGRLVAIVRNGRVVSVKNPIYILLSHLWLLVRPVRPCIRKAGSLIKRGLIKVTR